MLLDLEAGCKCSHDNGSRDGTGPNYDGRDVYRHGENSYYLTVNRVSESYTTISVSRPDR